MLYQLLYCFINHSAVGINTAKTIVSDSCSEIDSSILYTCIPSKIDFKIPYLNSLLV